MKQISLMLLCLWAVAADVGGASVLDRTASPPARATQVQLLKAGRHLKFVTQRQKSAPTSDAVDVDSAITAAMGLYHVPGLAACIIYDGDIAWEGYYGYADAALQQPITRSSVFMLASVSKTVVASAVLQLCERQQLDLDTDINDYLPFSVINPHYPDVAITLRMILAHTSSIAYNFNDWWPLVVWGADSPLSLAEYLREYLPPDGGRYSSSNFNSYPPGGGAEYSNIAYALAAYVVEQASGLSFEEFCRDNLFEVLEMSETSWHLANLEPDNLVMPLRYDAGVYVPYGHPGLPVYPCGQLRTSAAQLANFLACFMNWGRYNQAIVLDSLSVVEMRSIQYPEHRVLPETEWGLGWYRFDIGSGWIYGHEGGFFGVSTGMYFSPTAGWGVIMLSNADPLTTPEDDFGFAVIANLLFDAAGDSDSDGVIAILDNCPETFNPQQEDSDGDGIGDACDQAVSAWEQFAEILPAEPLSLEQNYPNPFNAITTIEYHLARRANVCIEVFDILGRTVFEQRTRHDAPGIFRITWQANAEPSGVYFYRVKTDSHTETKKMLLLK